MEIYTFFFQYKELTYVHQFESCSLQNALTSWADNIKAIIITDADEFFERTISEEINDRLTKQGVTTRDGLVNVWCCTFVFDDDAFGDLNITITKNNKISHKTI